MTMPRDYCRRCRRSHDSHIRRQGREDCPSGLGTFLTAKVRVRRTPRFVGPGAGWKIAYALRETRARIAAMREAFAQGGA
jgi:hypothetical protein